MDTLSKYHKSFVQSHDGGLRIELYSLQKAEVCEILGKCGFVLRWLIEKTLYDVEFFFSSA